MTTRGALPRGRTDSRVEPHSDDLVRVGDGLAFGLGTLDLGSGFGGCALAFLCSAVRTHSGGMATGVGPGRAAIFRLNNVSNA